MPSTAETDAEDVNDFLKRIQELGIKRDQEDEERNKKLEEEILQGRKERQARRAERARSISPIKDSPTNTPPPYKPASAETRTQSPNAAFTPTREIQRPSQLSSRDQLLGDTMGRLTGEDSPAKDYGPSASNRSSDALDKNVVHTISVRASPSSAMPSRSPTLSWQRRPNSQSPVRSNTRPFSMISSDTPTRSPIEVSELSSRDAPPMGRDEIAQSLAAKDPTWFRQTSDRGQGSAAYRKTQVEVEKVDEAIPNINRVGLPGMSRTPKREYSDGSDAKETKPADIDRSISPSRAGSSKDSITQSSAYGSSASRTGFVSPMPATSAQRFPQPGSISSAEGNIDQPVSARSLAMSPSQGRISPERMDRPISPTKGMGGFVQSAMMKRSDSVNKRWSVQSPAGLTRGNSTVSNRSSQDLSKTPLGSILNSPTREPRPSSLSRENTPLSTSRPSSSHSNATVGLETTRHGRLGAQRGPESEATLDGDFVKPGIPASQLQAPSDAPSAQQVERPENLALSGSPPQSPSKSTDTRRWSPTKSSWLESALNKPDSPKPKPAPPQQPSWMSEINKAKQKGPTAETSNKPSGHKHQVSIGGLMRSPPMGGIAQPLTVGGLPAGFSSGTFPISQQNKASDAAPKTKAVGGDVPSKPTVETSETASSKKTETKPSPPIAVKPSSPVIGKTKPQTPPKKDFISNPKPKQVLPPVSKDEPEFKNVFGQLRRTKTQNYVAPDELKDNILRGKAGLSLTGGPKKTERRDEFKDAILKKKEDFKKAQLEGTGVTKSTTKVQAELPEALRKKAQLGGVGATQSTLPPVQTQVPEALLKKANLGRVNTVVSGPRDNNVSGKGLSDTLSKNNLPYNSPKPKISPEAGSPTAPQGKLDAGGKLAGRFNPALAGILARGPPPKPAGSSRKVSSNLETANRLASKGPEKQSSGPQLTHMTKGRARGPRRKAPSAVAQGKAQSEAAISPLKSSGSPLLSSSPLERRSTAPVS
ncbi:hypothetical protein V490_08844 [Pseudogymnoascus sp. VKM F-3557]|nr:hypothetical protein V490_08844 [Pseudogymnoascus sp. VKM F-3557]